MGTRSSILAWRIPRTEKPGGVQSMGHKVLDTTEVSQPSTTIFIPKADHVNLYLKPSPNRRSKLISFCAIN